MDGWMDGTTHWSLVKELELLDSEFSTCFPLKSQWEPEMVRPESVRLQVRVAEVWLMTTDGSVLMFGASDKERKKCKALILTIETTRWMRATLIAIVNTQQWSSWEKGSEDTDLLLLTVYKLHCKKIIMSDKR